MPRKAAGHEKILLCLPPKMVKAIKRAAGERNQTYSALAEDWLAKGQAEYEARKAPEK
jgi:NAD(P)H-flavin reductase